MTMSLVTMSILHWANESNQFRSRRTFGLSNSMEITPFRLLVVNSDFFRPSDFFFMEHVYPVTTTCQLVAESLRKSSSPTRALPLDPRSNDNSYFFEQASGSQVQENCIWQRVANCTSCSEGLRHFRLQNFAISFFFVSSSILQCVPN